MRDDCLISASGDGSTGSRCLPWWLWPLWAKWVRAVDRAALTVLGNEVVKDTHEETALSRMSAAPAAT